MSRDSFFGGPVPLLAAGIVAVVLQAPLPTLAASLGDCVTVRVEAPFRLPDGLLYPAGPLTLCDSGRHSPVDSLHKILVGGSSIGLFASTRRSAEIQLMESPQVVFNRDADGNLELIGYSLTSSGRSIAYRLKGTREAWQANYHRQVGGAPVAAIVATTGTH